MKTSELIELRLGHSEEQLDTWKRLGDEAIAFVCEALDTAEDGDWEEERADIDRCKARLPGVNAAGVQAFAQECLAACRGALQRIGARQRTRRAEIAGLIASVREAVAALHEDGPALSSSLDESTARMDTLAAIDDPRQLKERLAAEVAHLKKLVLERQQGWTAANAEFERRVASLETQLVQSQREASRDPLTGAANRRAIEGRMQKCLDSSNRQFVFALVDVDDFKEINDTYGHPVGDTVLVTLVRALRKHMRPEDTVARFGGDEFALLLPGMTVPAATANVRDLFASVRQIALPDGRQITVSCGLSEVAAGDTIASMIARADQALYAAKRQGKNRLSIKSAPFIHSLLAAARQRTR